MFIVLRIYYCLHTFILMTTHLWWIFSGQRVIRAELVSTVDADFAVVSL